MIRRDEQFADLADIALRKAVVLEDIGDGVVPSLLLIVLCASIFDSLCHRVDACCACRHDSGSSP